MTVPKNQNAWYNRDMFAPRQGLDITQEELESLDVDHEAATKYATIVLSPHQDDETIRLAAYIAYMSDRGDDVALVSLTNGAATGVRKTLGLTNAQCTEWRDREQYNAWQWLTDGRGASSITRLNFQDGSVSKAQVKNALAAQFAGMTGKKEIYIATWHYDRKDSAVADQHVDHKATVDAAKEFAATNSGVTLRFARHPSAPGTGVTYTPTKHQFNRIESAVGCYTTIGQRSVSKTFKQVLSTGGKTIVTA